MRKMIISKKTFPVGLRTQKTGVYLPPLSTLANSLARRSSLHIGDCFQGF